MNILKDNLEIIVGNYAYEAKRINSNQFNLIWDGELVGRNYDEIDVIKHISDGSWKVVDTLSIEEQFLKYFNEIRVSKKLNIKQSMRLLQKALQELTKDLK